MWLAAAALRRPVTVFVILIALALTAMSAIRRMSIDIFPVMGIPVIYVVQPYGGVDPSQMEGFISSFYEYHFFTSPASRKWNHARSRGSHSSK